MAKTLKDWRIDRLYSIRGLATAAGISSKTVHDVELGNRTPTLQTMRKLCRALDVKPEDVTEFANVLAQLHETD